MKQPLFKAGKKYTFSDYFEMGQPTEEIVAALGYSLAITPLTLPRARHVASELFEPLSVSYYALLSKISLNSEIAKREVMIAPLLHAIIKQLDARLSLEYPLDINDKLSGTIDYLFRSAQDLIVIEAKKGDLERGFNQLAAEMIALDMYEDEDKPPQLYGAITIGEVWRFARLDRATHHITKDAHTFRFPEDVAEIFAILMGILS